MVRENISRGQYIHYGKGIFLVYVSHQPTLEPLLGISFLMFLCSCPCKNLSLFLLTRHHAVQFIYQEWGKLAPCSFDRRCPLLLQHPNLPAISDAPPRGCAFDDESRLEHERIHLDLHAWSSKMKGETSVLEDMFLGRPGLPSSCVFLFSSKDILDLESFQGNLEGQAKLVRNSSEQTE